MTPNDDSNAGLGRRMAKGGLILILLRVAMRLLSLISIMILFRVLVPDDFGLVALATLAVGLVEMLSEFGFDQVLIQQRNAQRGDYDTTWTLTLLRGVFCAVVLLLIAQPAAEFLKDPRLTPMIMWLALAPLLDGLQNVGVVDFTKEFQFGKDFVLKVSQKFIGFCVTVTLAFWLRDYWALVIGILAGKGAGLVLSYVLHPFRPRLHLEGWQRIFRFSIWIMLNNVVLYAGTQTDKVLLKRYYDAHMVGIFRVAEEICSVVMELVWPVERALYAGYAKLAGNLAELRRMLLTSIGFVAMIGVPMSIGILLVAEPLIAILLGEKGRGAIPFVQVLVLHGAIRSSFTGAYPVFMALGKPYVNAQFTLLSVVVRLVMLFSLFPVLGAMAAPWSLVGGSIASFLAVWIQVKRHVELRWRDFPAALWQVVVATALMAAVLHGATPELERSVVGRHAWLLLTSEVGIGAVVYALSIVALWYLRGRPDGPERHMLEIARVRLRRAFNA